MNNCKVLKISISIFQKGYRKTYQVKGLITHCCHVIEQEEAPLKVPAKQITSCQHNRDF